MFTEYSLWFVPLIVLIAFFIAYYVYLFKVKNKRFADNKRMYLLFSLRFLGLFLVLFLLLSPVKRIKHKIIEKPTIVLLQDNSKSLSYSWDSLFYKGEYLKNLDKLYNNLSKNYNTVKILFGDNTTVLNSNDKFQDTVKYNELRTDISQALDFVSENYPQEYLSAIILATDGISNYGDNFLNSTNNIFCPVYTVAMGDTEAVQDVLIYDIQYNKITYTDTEYPLRVTVKAKYSQNEQISLFMTKDGKTAEIKSFKPDNNDYFTSVDLTQISKKAGIEKISFHVSHLTGERTEVNNKKDIFIEVLDTKKKVLITANAPHPDISAVKTALISNGNYTVDVNIAGNNPKNTLDYDLVILHSLPDNTVSYNTVKNLIDKGTNLLFIIGQSTNIQLFNALNTGISINALTNSVNNTSPLYNSEFPLFTTDANTEDILTKLPPLQSNAAKYNLSANIRTLFYQKIGSVSTSYPLIAFNNDANSKIGFILGENIWRWRLQNYLINETTEQFDGLISKTSQLLSVKSDKERFRVEHKDIYLQNENVVFTAQFYNDNFELINTPEVTLNIQSTSDNSKSSILNSKHSFGKNNNAYYLNLSVLDEGEYTFTAKTVYNNKEYTQSGSFAVTSADMERSDLTAKYSDLYTLSAKTNATTVRPKDIKDLAEMIKNNDNIKPVIHVSEENKKFTSLWWYWMLIILSLGGEWFLRKYWGKI